MANTDTSSLYSLKRIFVGLPNNISVVWGHEVSEKRDAQKDWDGVGVWATLS